MSKKVKWLSILIAFIAVNNIIAFSFPLNAPYYMIMIGGLLFGLFQSRITYINPLMIVLYFACMLSIIGNDIPAFFQPWGRLSSFLAISLLLSSAIGSVFLYRFRIRTFEYARWLMQYVVILSAIAYFAGISFGRRDFAGITTQSMLIAPISAYIILYTLYLLNIRKHIRFKQKAYMWGLLSCAFITLLLAASRTAIIGTLGAILYYFYIANKAHLSRFFKWTFLFAGLLVITFPIWDTYLSNIQEKNEGSLRAGGIASSRDQHWGQRINEFKTSPMIGIGFASVSTDIDSGSTFDPKTGLVETGSSWLSVLSMTGIIGFMAFAGISVQTFRALRRIRRYNRLQAAYLGAVGIFWTFHMMAEGYIFGAGGFLFFSIWLYWGYIDALDKTKLSYS